MYMTSEEGVSASCAKRVTLDIILVSPGSTSTPLFLKTEDRNKAHGENEKHEYDRTLWASSVQNQTYSVSCREGLTSQLEAPRR